MYNIAIGNFCILLLKKKIMISILVLTEKIITFRYICTFFNIYMHKYILLYWKRFFILTCKLKLKKKNYQVGRLIISILYNRNWFLSLIILLHKHIMITVWSFLLCYLLCHSFELNFFSKPTSLN